MLLDQVLICYSHKDTQWLKDLETHLKPYLRAGSIKSWSDTQISPGSQWFNEIKSALTKTKVVVLLVTPDFIASDFIQEDDLGPLLKEAEQSGVRILWVPVRESSYKKTPLMNYQTVINPTRPLAGMSAPARDRAWVNICEEIDTAIKEPRESRRPFPSIADKLLLLREAQFGRRVAEDESQFLAKYFVETNSWRQIFNNEVDVVYGAKGAGKSALYSLLVARSGELFDRNVLLVPAENPRGTPVFSELVTDPPASQREFVGLWKLYISTILYSTFKEYDFSGTHVNEIRDALAAESLIQGAAPLKTVLQSVWSYVRRFFRPESLEGGIEIDPISNLPKGVRGKITFSEPTITGSNSGQRSVDDLLSLANKVLENNGGINVWILLDRLDVAFAEHPDLEANALQGLFRVYLDLMGYEHVKLKIFLRSDIWKRITEAGFREASHITRTLTIAWNQNSLLNLVVRRLLFNKVIVDHFDVKPNDILKSTENQERFFYLLFPEQVEVGANKPKTFEWILGRTKDGIGNAPREVIHLMNSLRTTEIERMELGAHEIDTLFLFSRTTFKSALQDVSKVRLEQTLFAEYPKYRQLLEVLRGAKTSHTVDSLMRAWNESRDATLDTANRLVDIGFFEKRGPTNNSQFWIPFLYRDALELVQGTAE